MRAGLGNSGNAINKVIHGVWSVLIVANRLKLFKFCAVEIVWLDASVHIHLDLMMPNRLHCKLCLFKTLLYDLNASNTPNKEPQSVL